MAVVTFWETNATVTVPSGTTVLQAARQAGFHLDSPCNCSGTCGKCKVQLEPHSLCNIVAGGTQKLSPAEASRGFVLSCEALITGDIVVRALPREQGGELQIMGAGVRREVELAPYISKAYDTRAMLTRVLGCGKEIAQEAGDTRSASYGVVVDIGTTTLSASLIDLATGTELACEGSLNPQSRHAQDVLSRIRFASTEKGLQTMHALLIEEIGRVIDSLLSKAGVTQDNLYEIVFSGNTSMLHLALRENPASLGKFPYPSRLRGDEQRPASPFNLPAAPCAVIYLPPVISAFVGPDITSGIAATGLASSPGVTLLVDIGTNGEMVINDNGRMFATSTAAGPAFEGMNISCGMRATAGAIETISIDGDAEVSVKTIGDAEAAGICGSGLIDAVAELVSCGVILPNGRFVSPDHAELLAGLKGRLERQDGKPCFRITERVSLSQKDVRQMQLAKGAVRAGIEFLLRKAGVAAEGVDRVLIAGSFGFHLRAESLLAIGLLPAVMAGRISFVGNSSKAGGEMFLLNHPLRREMAALVDGIEVVDLASCPDFDSCFVHSLGFPTPITEPTEAPCVSP